MKREWSCLKCQHTSFDVDEVRVTGGGLSRFFDVQNRKFSAVTCRNCSFTEFYKSKSGMVGDVADFFLGS